MKAVIFLQRVSLSLAVGLIFALGTHAQTENPKTRDRIAPDETKIDSTETKRIQTTKVKTKRSNRRQLRLRPSRTIKLLR